MTATVRAIDIALAYLAAMEARDLDSARAHVADGDLELVFPGGRTFTRIEQIVQNSSGRYRFVKKRITGREAWAAAERTKVLITGTLYGEWPDGTAFDDIRFVDLFEIDKERIVKQHVWNDAGEHILAQQQEARK